MKANKVVYIHRKATDGTIFYVGIGNKDRAKQIQGRSHYWKRTVNKYDYTIHIIEEGLTHQEACESEIALIELIGRRDLGTGYLVNLTNGGEGIVGSTCHNKGVICLKTGVLFDSIRSYCEFTGDSHSTISMFLNGGKLKEKYVRFVENNKIIRNTNQDIDLLDRDIYTELDGVDLVSEDYDYESNEVMQHELDELNKNYKNISKYERDLVRLLAIEDYSFTKLSEATGIGRSTLYNTYKNAINKLKNKALLNKSSNYSKTHKNKNKLNKYIKLKNN